MTEHKELRLVPHQPAHLYALVADVPSYPQFLPWCKAARIRSKSEDRINAELMVGFGFFSEKFVSRVDLNRRDLQIDVNYTEGPFKSMTNAWAFHPHEQGCEVDFFVQFEFESRLLHSVVQPIFFDAVKKMVQAFEARADSLYDRVP